MKKIAIYGKGGIGKSTIASNISAALTKKGNRVLQIGCDPKHDSTRLLLGGGQIPTVLESLRERGPDDLLLEDLIFNGYKGCSCVETGGPEPGVGCAGRGILSTFELLEKKGAISDDSYDVVIFDVLGDVVCGGFAVPLRSGNADAIYIVTSGEFMSLYASNNILKGVSNYDSGNPRVGGIICNLRGMEDELELVNKFSERIGVPVISTIPRSNSFRAAEREICPVNELDQELERTFSDLADHIMDQSEYFSPSPLDDINLESLLGKSDLKNPKRLSTKKDVERTDNSKGFTYRSKSMRNREPLSGCAYAGAINTLSQIRGSIALSHGPRSCSQISHQMILSSARRTFSFTGHIMRHMIDPHILSSDMSESVMIYGGSDNLEKAIEKATVDRPDCIFIVTTCASGIIGEDVLSVMENAKKKHDDIEFHLMNADGNISGDFMQGVIDSSIMVASEIVDWASIPEGRKVNLIGEKNIAMNHEHNFHFIKGILNALDLEVNCRFICNTTIDEIKGLNRAALNILAHRDYFGRALSDYFVNEHGLKFTKNPFPIGYNETVDLICELSKYFSADELAQPIISENRKRYEEYMSPLRGQLEGKRIMLVALSQSIDWIVETAKGLGMDIVKVGICDYSQEEGLASRYAHSLPLEMNYDPSKRKDDILDLEPDLVISNYSSVGLPNMASYSVIPLCPDIGFFTGVEMAYRWKNILSLPRTEGWKKDAYL